MNTSLVFHRIIYIYIMELYIMTTVLSLPFGLSQWQVAHPSHHKRNPFLILSLLNFSLITIPLIPLLVHIFVIGVFSFLIFFLFIIRGPLGIWLYKLKIGHQICFFSFFIISRPTVHLTGLDLRGGPCRRISCEVFSHHSLFVLHPLMGTSIDFYYRWELWGPHVRSKPQILGSTYRS